MEEREQLIRAVNDAIQDERSGVSAIDEAAAQVLRIKRRDVRCLNLLHRRGEATPSKLARQLSMSMGAVTTLLDRLADAGYVHRTRDKGDRRRILVGLTDRAQQLMGEIYGPMDDEERRLFDRFSNEQLQTISDFIYGGRALLAEHAQRIRRL